MIEQCNRSGMPYVTERWLGGTLTNFRTIRSRLERLEELENTLDGEQALSLFQENDLDPESRAAKDRTQLERHPAHEPASRSLLVVDPRREHIAVAEARKLGIKVVALLDTDCDPDLIDLPIPGNDDSMRSIELVVSRLTDAIRDGRAAAPPEPPPPVDAGQAGGGDRERRRGAAAAVAAKAFAAPSSSATPNPKPLSAQPWRCRPRAADAARPTRRAGRTQRGPKGLTRRPSATSRGPASS